MIALVALPALALLVLRLARRGAGASAGPAGRSAGEPQMSKKRPSGPRLTTGVVPITASESQH